MSKSIQCSELFPGCDYHGVAESEEALLQMAAEHAATEHGITELTEEIVAKVKGCIREA
jgi:predicted small metal-binding protein